MQLVVVGQSQSLFCYILSFFGVKGASKTMKIMKSKEEDGEKQIASGSDAKEKIADLSEDKKR